MSFFRCYGLLFMLSCCATTLWAQPSSLRNQLVVPTQDTIQLDSLSIYPNSFRISIKNSPLETSDYSLDFAHARLILFKKYTDTLRITYRVLPMNLGKVYVARDPSVIFNTRKGNQDEFLQTTTYDMKDLFGGTSLSKSGSISRGISFGNKQNVGVNSSLNLELSGDISPNLKLLASISDNNLPIQPDGNTNKLQEFDNIFIQVYNSRFKLIVGNFWLTKPRGYFLNYRKRAQGVTLNYQWGKDSTHVWKTEVSGALSKGKFARQIIQGIEGNQGPYRLKGNENEPFIIVLSGTERVYIDGKLLARGQEYDYTINYNSAEVVFTSRNQLTKDSRIVIEFQYSDQNYARSLLQSSTTYTTKKMEAWFNAYSEQDAKNQPIQQSLTPAQKLLLSKIGDTLELARTNSIDSVGFIENQVLYRLTDSLGYDSVLVYSVKSSNAFYRATFTFVGSGKGDYIFNNFNALGKIYKWVAPIAGVSQGDYTPSRIIITPKQKQLLSAGIAYHLRKNLTLETELAYSKNDLNTFSRLNSEDDNGVANRTRILGVIPFGRDSLPKWKLETTIELEGLGKNFSPIEQYRAVEFDRDWNTRNKGFNGNQLALTVAGNLVHRTFGAINLDAQRFSIGTDYEGLRSHTSGTWKQNGLYAKWDASYLSSKSTLTNQFVRHRIELSKSFRHIKIGYTDDHELNRFTGANNILSTNSYQFFDYRFYLSNGDSVKNNYTLFYRERFDQRSDSTSLVSVAKAQTTGGELKITTWENQTLNVLLSYRELKILNNKLINQTPENTLTGRIDYELRILKGALTLNNFYEIGSGLELKREFLYIQVNTGQGIYTWIDYNKDGIKDLNEFEIAQFADQASYIRVFTPSNTYTKTYSNELNQSIYWRPERIWAAKKGIKKWLMCFSDQARVRINRKTNVFNGLEAFNPFSSQIRDTTLISTNLSLRNTLFFNRTSSIFSAEYTFQDLSSKTLLASGFDSKANRYHELFARWNIERLFSIETKGQLGTKDAQADYTVGRNYSLAYYFIQPSFIYQPTTTFRVTLDGRYSFKKNNPVLGGEKALVYELGATFKYNETLKGSLQGGLKLIRIDYNGSQNSALGFEMLEALKPGINYTWNIGYQRTISKSLQLSVQYNGRKSENSTTVHAGGMEVRAFF